MYPYLQVNRLALQHNGAMIREYVKTPIIGVIKNDGYGVSLLEVAKAWTDNGATMLAVSRHEDVFTLRQNGFNIDILMLSPIVDRHILTNLVRSNVILPITSLDSAEFYSQNSPSPVRVHIAVDTGMGRFGIHWTDMLQLTRIYETKNLIFDGIYSHFAAAFEKRYHKTKLQLSRFLKVCYRLEQIGYSIGMRHIANSCAALRFPETRLDAVRIGSALVGQVCARVPVPLEQAALCVAQVIDRKSLQPGDTTGYGSICTVKRNTNAIIVTLGHETGIGYIATPDNYPPVAFLRYLRQQLHLRHNTPCVEYGGKQLRLIGRLGNQFSLFDAGNLEIHPGETVLAKANLMYPWKRREFI